MKKSALYILALLIATIGLAGMIYKWRVLKFPLVPNQKAEVWTVEAKVLFKSAGGPNTVLFYVPGKTVGDTPGFNIAEENLVSRGYSQDFTKDDGRVSEWTMRDSRVANSNALYYRADVVRDNREPDRIDSTPKIATPLELDPLGQAALETLFELSQKESADVVSFSRNFVRRFTGELGDEAEILAQGRDTPIDRARFFTQALAARNIPARVAQGFSLTGKEANKELVPFLQVFDQGAWTTIDLSTADKGFPDDFFVWTKTAQPVVSVTSDTDASVEFVVIENLTDALKIAEKNTEVRDTRLINFSLLSLPASAQANFKILLMVPLGAFVMLLLRNVIGIKTFGTFMPVLIALAFEKTNLLSGVTLFVIVIGLGLLVRFFMEKIRLLLVPRLTAVLILVVVLMAFVSVLSNRLGFEVGMSVALFPIVIMAMTIERMCVAWDERGPAYALRQGFGSLATACLAYLVMSIEYLRHLFFVFPELLLVLFALTLLIGRYSGYRLTELTRFKSLAK
jgi:hypothetical protein